MLAFLLQSMQTIQKSACKYQRVTTFFFYCLVLPCFSTDVMVVVVEHIYESVGLLEGEIPPRVIHKVNHLPDGNNKYYHREHARLYPKVRLTQKASLLKEARSCVKIKEC